jgi:hypothetical protein
MAKALLSLTPTADRPLVYLGGPYSHVKPLVREQRFIDLTKAAAWLIEKTGLNVFSPISHSHPLAEIGGLQGNWDFWKNIDETYLRLSCGMVILRLSEWKKSVGVGAEIEIARRMGLPIMLMSPDVTSYYFTQLPK